MPLTFAQRLDHFSALLTRFYAAGLSSAVGRPSGARLIFIHANLAGKLTLLYGRHSAVLFFWPTLSWPCGNAVADADFAAQRQLHLRNGGSMTAKTLQQSQVKRLLTQKSALAQQVGETARLCLEPFCLAASAPVKLTISRFDPVCEPLASPKTSA